MAENHFDSMFAQIWERKMPFLLVFFVTVLVTYLVLYVLDFYPEPVAEETATTTTESITEVNEAVTVNSERELVTAVANAAETAPKPRRIIFDRLDKEVAVLNPRSREIEALDAALLDGAVRHPDSADFSEDGNIFILGHSSYLPNVFNKNYQAFNEIQKLKWGDTIRLQSENAEYIYKVRKVYEAKAAEVTVPQTPGEARLTLATCNSFGAKDDRFIVEAELVEQVLL